ncbi:MAG: Crp/Fnr family transcriptional regulator [Peptococcaceae bacterium]|nr:Crp/Fnr family transcriptional regulator [Peptococcaceae bacterium]
MQEYYGILCDFTLFAGIKSEELGVMLSCIGAEVVSVKKDQIILAAGEKPEQLGIVLAGQLHIIREDYDGKRDLLAAAVQGDIFAEALCCAGVAESPITVMAVTDGAVLLLSFARLLHSCPNVCAFHTRLIGNMLGLLANKNIQLQNKMEIISLKTIRSKVLYYLETFVPKQGNQIKIPFNREELADYLCVERSALSHELARMKRDGLIEYRKNVFVLRK